MEWKVKIHKSDYGLFFNGILECKRTNNTVHSNSSHTNYEDNNNNYNYY